MIRINNEYNKYDYNFMTNPFYLVNENHFRIDSFINRIKQNHINCKAINSSNCIIDNGLEIKEKNNYLFLIRKKWWIFL